jgi:hypothetical protein
VCLGIFLSLIDSELLYKKVGSSKKCFLHSFFIVVVDFFIMFDRLFYSKNLKLLYILL